MAVEDFRQALALFCLLQYSSPMEGEAPSSLMLANGLIDNTDTAACAIDRVSVGSFWTMVQSSRGTGMATNLRPAHCGHRPQINDAGQLHQLPVDRIIELARSSSSMEAAVGIAAINSILNQPAADYIERNAEELIADHGRGKDIAIIGDFPFAQRLRSHCENVWVFERPPRMKQEHLSEADMAELLPRAAVVAISSTTLLNHTLGDILTHLHPESYVLLLGPSTPLCPFLFRFGIDALCGTVIDDPQRAMTDAIQGAVLKQIGGTRRVVVTAPEKA